MYHINNIDNNHDIELNNNNNNNNNNDNSKLFNKIIKNKYLFNIILFHLQSNEKIFKRLEDYLNYKQYERLLSIDIHDKEILKYLTSVPSLQHLSINKCEDQISNSLIKQIPNTVTSLDINGRVGGPLPASIKYLKLFKFSKPIDRDYIPIAVEKLVFCDSGFDYRIESFIELVNLKYLDMGKSFKSYSLSNCIPPSLETLKLGAYSGPFNRGDLMNIKKLILLSDCSLSIVKDSLPSTLTTLELHVECIKPLSQIPLPPSLTSLYYDTTVPFTKETPISLPNLKILQFGHQYNSLLHYNQFPINLQEIILGTNYSTQLTKDSLPKSLSKLTFNLNYIHPIVVPKIFPNSITYLDLNNSLSTHQLQINSLPSSLTLLKLPQQFNHEIPLNCLPSSLLYLYFGLCFNKSIQFCLPPNLVEIHFGHHYNTPIEPNSLPPSITLISFSPTGNFNQEFSINSIPKNTTSIQLSYKYNHPIDTLSILPKSVKQIKFNNKTIYNISNSIYLSSQLLNPNL